MDLHVEVVSLLTIFFVVYNFKPSLIHLCSHVCIRPHHSVYFFSYDSH